MARLRVPTHKQSSARLTRELVCKYCSQTCIFQVIASFEDNICYRGLLGPLKDRLRRTRKSSKLPLGSTLGGQNSVIAVQTLQHTTFGLDVYSREKLDLQHGTHTDGLLCMVTDGLISMVTDGLIILT